MSNDSNWYGKIPRGSVSSELTYNLWDVAVSEATNFVFLEQSYISQPAQRLWTPSAIICLSWHWKKIWRRSLSLLDVQTNVHIKHDRLHLLTYAKLVDFFTHILSIYSCALFSFRGTHQKLLRNVLSCTSHLFCHTPSLIVLEWRSGPKMEETSVKTRSLPEIFRSNNIFVKIHFHLLRCLNLSQNVKPSSSTCSLLQNISLLQ